MFISMSDLLINLVKYKVIKKDINKINCERTGLFGQSIGERNLSNNDRRKEIFSFGILTSQSKSNKQKNKKVKSIVVYLVK